MGGQVFPGILIPIERNNLRYADVQHRSPALRQIGDQFEFVAGGVAILQIPHRLRNVWLVADIAPGAAWVSDRLGLQDRVNLVFDTRIERVIYLGVLVFKDVSIQTPVKESASNTEVGALSDSRRKERRADRRNR